MMYGLAALTVAVSAIPLLFVIWRVAKACDVLVVRKSAINGAAVAVGRGVDVIGEIIEDNRRADEVSGRVKALGPVNSRRTEVPPRDDEAAVGKGRHVLDNLSAGLIEDVDEIALDEAISGIIDRRADFLITEIVPTHYEPAVGQSSDVRKELVPRVIGTTGYAHRANDVPPVAVLIVKKMSLSNGATAGGF
jgi:hypothetical protein